MNPRAAALPEAIRRAIAIHASLILAGFRNEEFGFAAARTDREDTFSVLVTVGHMPKAIAIYCGAVEMPLSVAVALWSEACDAWTVLDADERYELWSAFETAEEATRRAAKLAELGILPRSEPAPATGERWVN